MQYVESSKKERCTLQYIQKRDDHWLHAVEKLNALKDDQWKYIVLEYTRERDQRNIQNYKNYEKQILQIQLSAEHNSFRVWFERHQCIPTELKRQSLVKICNTGFWWHLLCNVFRAGKSGNCTVAFRKSTKGWGGCRENCDPKPTVKRGTGHCWPMFWNIARMQQGWKVSI